MHACHRLGRGEFGWIGIAIGDRLNLENWCVRACVRLSVGLLAFDYFDDDCLSHEDRMTDLQKASSNDSIIARQMQGLINKASTPRNQHICNSI